MNRFITEVTITEVTITEVEYAGDHDRETVVVATTGEADEPEYSLLRTAERARRMLQVSPDLTALDSHEGGTE